MPPYSFFHNFSNFFTDQRIMLVLNITLKIGVTSIICFTRFICYPSYDQLLHDTFWQFLANSNVLGFVLEKII